MRRYPMNRHVYRLWELPIFALWWMVVGIAWVSVWTAVWCWEAYAVGTVRAARTTSRIFGWSR